MKVIKTYHQNSVKDWERSETRVFNILNKLSFDELSDLCTYRGMEMSHYTTKNLMIKGFMVGLGIPLTNKHFNTLGEK